MTKSKHALEKLFYNYIDYQYNYYYQTKNLMITKGINIDLTDLGHFSQFNNSVGGINDNSQTFFLINKTTNLLSIFFSKNIIGFKSIFNTINELEIQRCLHSSVIDKSLYLNLRNRTSSLILFEDEEISLDFYCGDKKIASSVKLYNINDESPINISLFNYVDVDNLIKDLTEFHLIVKLSILNKSKLRTLFEQEILPLEKTLSDIWKVFHNLIMTKHYFKFLKQITQNFPNLPNEWLDLSFENYSKKALLLSQGDFNNLDPFDWSELLLGFHFLGNFSNYKKLKRIDLIKKIRFLEKKNLILIKFRKIV